MTRALSRMPVRHQWGYRPLTAPCPAGKLLTLSIFLGSFLSFPRHAIAAAGCTQRGRHCLQVNGTRHLSGLQQGALPESKAGAGRLLRVLGRGVRGQPVPRHRHHRVRALRARRPRAGAAALRRMRPCLSPGLQRLSCKFANKSIPTRCPLKVVTRCCISLKTSIW